MEFLSIIMDKSFAIPAALSVVSFAGGYATNSSKPHLQECAPEIGHVRNLERQLAAADQATLDRVIDATRACKEAEEQVCKEKIETFKKSYRQLRCSICEEEGQ